MDQLPVETTFYSLSDEPPSPAMDRRSGERHLTLFRVGTLFVDGRRELCLIKNLSSGGMMLRAYCRLTTGQKLAIELKTGQPLTGRVHWVDDQQVGISFDAPIDIISFLAPAEDGLRPRMPRIEVNAHAAVRAGADTFRVRACDISQGGLKVATKAALPANTAVVVTLPGLAPQPGVVRWSDGTHVGITFNRLLALPVLVDWLRAQRDTSRAA